MQKHEVDYSSACKFEPILAKGIEGIWSVIQGELKKEKKRYKQKVYLQIQTII